MIRLKRIIISFAAVVAASCQTGQPFSGTDYAAMVDTRIGTQGRGLECGYTFLGATYPFGMVQLTPSFFSPQRGIVVNQISGAGCSQMGNFPVIPVSGKVSVSPDDMNNFPVYKDIQGSEAGYMSLGYGDDISCEATVSLRSGVLRFSFPSSDEGSVIIGSGVNSTFVNHASVKVTSPSTCEGYADGGDFCGSRTDYRVYFAAEFSRPAIETGTWLGKDLRKGRNVVGGRNSGCYFTFDTSEDKTIEYKIAISYVSVENARENLKADNGGRTFDEVLTDTRKVWNENLGKIEVKGGSEDRMKQFYTHFYHSLIHPGVFSDVNGEYMGADYNVHKVSEGRTAYSVFSGWDTYRTQCQLLAMLYPKVSSDMMQSLVDFAEQSGGLGRWILANVETGIMHGDPSSIIIANTYAFGGRDFDVRTAYEHMKRGATVPGTRSQNVEVRPGLSTYMEKGIENASLCLEYTSADYAIGRFAIDALGNDHEGRYFIDRAGNWRNLYDPSTNWLRSRNNDDMSWKSPDADWREATKENYFWMVPYDLPALIDTMGGASAAEARLDSLFVRIDAGYDDHYFAAGNEPDFHVPWIYNIIGKPYKTSDIISRIFDEAYSSSPDGLPGNDDCGTMGAWYVFASIGMYPMIPGEAVFSLNKPQFSDISIHFEDGTLNIRTGEGRYVRSLRLDGESYDSTWLEWNDITGGGTLEYETEDIPSSSWGTEN